MGERRPGDEKRALHWLSAPSIASKYRPIDSPLLRPGEIRPGHPRSQDEPGE
jgi:hypothetical protein